MAEIPNFPEKLLHLHHAWHEHSAHPDLPGRTIGPFEPGGGLEFLYFHHNFMRRFFTWNERDHFVDPAELTPWTAIPAEMKDPVKANWTSLLAAQEHRIEWNDPAYANVDALGRDIELGIHNQWLHTAAADVYGDQLVRSPSTSPRSTLFYKIHGLINHWWDEYLKNQPVKLKNQLKDALDVVEPDKTFEVKNRIKDAIDVPPPRPELAHSKKLKDSKDMVEGFAPPQPHTDFSELQGAGAASSVAELAQRLQVLEGEVARGQAFIQPAERPDVGGGDGGGE